MKRDFFSKEYGVYKFLEKMGVLNPKVCIINFTIIKNVRFCEEHSYKTNTYMWLTSVWKEFRMYVEKEIDSYK